jgi:hypothetical protein
LVPRSRWPSQYPARTLGHPFLDQWREDELAADADAQRAYQDGVARGDLQTRWPEREPADRLDLSPAVMAVSLEGALGSDDIQLAGQTNSAAKSRQLAPEAPTQPPNSLT